MLILIMNKKIKEQVDHKEKELSLLKLILKQVYIIVEKKEKAKSEKLLSDLENT